MTKAGEKLIAAAKEAVDVARCYHDLVCIKRTIVSETYRCDKCGMRMTQFKESAETENGF